MSTLTYNKTTHANSECHVYQWKIKDFLETLQNTNVREFRSVETIGRPQIKLQIFGHNKDIIDLSFSSPVTAFMNGRVSTGTDREIGEFNDVVNAYKWYYLATLHKTDVINSPSSYLYNKYLILNLTFNAHFMKKEINEKQSNINLQNILNDSLFADVTMKSSDGKEFKVHKVILASRSSVLKAHFEHGTTETHTNILNSPFESDVIEEIISYMYTEKVPRIKNLSKKMLAAANFYAMNELKALCEDDLQSELRVENVMEILELAKRTKAVTLQTSAMKFIDSLNYFRNHVDVGVTEWKIEFTDLSAF